jgi:L-asparaginase II
MPHWAMTNPVLVEVTRGGRVESVHRGSVAISDAAGNLQLELGEVNSAIFPRSALKPIQALPLLETGADEAFGLSTEEIALACASHSGEPQHTSRVAAWLERIGCSVDDLACGPQRPSHAPTAAAMVARGEAWTPLHNNCSGKHTGFMTLAKHLGAPVRGYEKIEHTVQAAMENTLMEITGITAPPPYGIDGCTVPAFAVPLKAMALAMARFADPSGLPDYRVAAAKRIVAAMIAHPELVGGTGRACTQLMEQSAKGVGSIVVKTGAEGAYVAMLPSLGLGVALKIDDGATRASEAVMAALLISLGLLRDEGAANAISCAPIENTRGVVVGHCRAIMAG